MNQPAAFRNIVLIGFMGSGKSSVGRLLARLLAGRFVDTDQLVVKQAGCEITEIFQKHGEEHFRQLETDALTSLRGQTGLVIATGGGIVLRPENVALLHELGFTVWLTASEDVIFNRVSRNKRRPLLHTEDPRKTVTELFARRRDLYAAASHHTIDSTTLSHQDVAHLIIDEAHRRFPEAASSDTP